MGWRDILAALIGAIIGGTITVGVFLFTSTQVRQETTARQLLSEVVALVSLQEAWLLQGDGSRTANLSDNPGLLEAQTGSGAALAEWLCRTADRIDPARVCGPFHRLG